jgi:hypothetical protein
MAPRRCFGGFGDVIGLFPALEAGVGFKGGGFVLLLLFLLLLVAFIVMSFDCRNVRLFYRDAEDAIPKEPLSITFLKYPLFFKIDIFVSQFIFLLVSFSAVIE